MIDLKAIEDRLNSDTAYKAEFLRDPAALLQKEGLSLASKHIEQLNGLAQELSNPDKVEAGSNLAAKEAGEPRIGIGIGWSF